MIPGEMKVMPGQHQLNPDKAVIKLAVYNTGDRPIQIGSHYHFFETNPALEFNREQTKGYRLNITAGTAIRFEPGQKRTIELIEYGGDKKIFGFRGDVMGPI